MENYTDHINDLTKEIYPYDDNYTQELIEIAKEFRTFDSALDEFLLSRGFDGDISDSEEKIRYITGKFTERGVPVPRNLKRWYSEHMRIDKKTAFCICFAFSLSLSETEEFLKKICLERGFDCHSVDEAVYYFAFRNSLSYAETKDILDRAPEPESSRINYDTEIFYTDAITEELDRFTTADELLGYLNENIGMFGYNNATSSVNIKKLWDLIASEDGLANREGRMTSISYKDLDRIRKEKYSDPSYENKTEYQIDKEIEEERLGQYSSERSVWSVILQILGFDEYIINSLDSDHSLKPILKDNRILHPLAEDAFPDKQGIDKILRGEHLSDTKMRKTMILLVFYRFWADIMLDRRALDYSAEGGDADRCISRINRYLLDSGYPELYEGNPFDWIFIFSSNDDTPLYTFREFMHEMYVLKENELKYRD